VAKALGDKQKPHTLYVRFNAMIKNCPVVEGKDFPDMDEVLEKAREDGSLSKTRSVNTVGKAQGKDSMKGKAKVSKKKVAPVIDSVTDSESDSPVPEPKRKRKTISAASRKKVKTEVEMVETTPETGVANEEDDCDSEIPLVKVENDDGEDDI